jgi:hypothetical protein
MPISIRLPPQTEQALAGYCADHALSKSEVIKHALEDFLTARTQVATPYQLGQNGFGADVTHEGDIARNTSRLLKEKFRG